MRVSDRKEKVPDPPASHPDDPLPSPPSSVVAVAATVISECPPVLCPGQVYS